MIAAVAPMISHANATITRTTTPITAMISAFIYFIRN